MFVIVAMGKGKEKNVANKQFRWSKPMHILLLEILVDEVAKEISLQIHSNLRHLH
jgi:hypothetical protein